MFEEDYILSDYERGFLEGTIDTDGYITLGKHKSPNVKRGFTWRVEMGITNTSIRYLEKTNYICNERGRISIVTTRPNEKTLYRLMFYSKVLRWLLPQLHLTIKEQQRLLLIDALQYLVERDKDECLEAIYLDIKSLNRKGKVE